MPIAANIVGSIPLTFHQLRTLWELRPLILRLLSLFVFGLVAWLVVGVPRAGATFMMGPEQFLCGSDIVVGAILDGRLAEGTFRVSGVMTVHLTIQVDKMIAVSETSNLKPGERLTATSPSPGIIDQFPSENPHWPGLKIKFDLKNGIFENDVVPKMRGREYLIALSKIDNPPVARIWSVDVFPWIRDFLLHPPLGWMNCPRVVAIP